MSYPVWQDNPNGTVSLIFPRWLLENLAEDLNHWQEISQDQYHLPQNWKRSAKWREERRQSIVYGNCLATIEVYLGRKEIRALMKQVKEKEER